jgi:hypothetical protein
MEFKLMQKKRGVTKHNTSKVRNVQGLSRRMPEALAIVMRNGRPSKKDKPFGEADVDGANGADGSTQIRETTVFAGGNDMNYLTWSSKSNMKTESIAPRLTFVDRQNERNHFGKKIKISHNKVNKIQCVRSSFASNNEFCNWLNKVWKKEIQIPILETYLHRFMILYEDYLWESIKDDPHAQKALLIHLFYRAKELFFNFMDRDAMGSFMECFICDIQNIDKQIKSENLKLKEFKLDDLKSEDFSSEISASDRKAMVHLGSDESESEEKSGNPNCTMSAANSQISPNPLIPDNKVLFWLARQNEDFRGCVLLYDSHKPTSNCIEYLKNVLGKLKKIPLTIDNSHAREKLIKILNNELKLKNQQLLSNNLFKIIEEPGEG